MTFRERPDYSIHLVADNVACANCEARGLVTAGREDCPNCKAVGTLSWLEGKPREVAL